MSGNNRLLSDDDYEYRPEEAFVNWVLRSNAISKHLI